MNCSFLGQEIVIASRIPPGHFEASRLEYLEAQRFLDELGINWKSLEGHLRVTWGHLGSLGGQLEVTWQLLGATWGSLEGHLGS